MVQLRRWPVIPNVGQEREEDTEHQGKRSSVYFSIDTDATPNKGVKGKGTAQIITDSKKAILIAEKIVTKYLGDSKSGYGKGLMESVRSGKEFVVEIVPKYYSVWDYSKVR